MRGLFITATGTGVGKTHITRALAEALTAARHRVHAIKPIETGCAPHAQDAIALAEACRQQPLAHAPGLYRATPPLAPRAIARAGGPAVDVAALALRTAALAEGADVTLVEGAGGVLVPLTATETIADFAAQLGYPALVVAPDGLGVLSHCLSAVEALGHRQVAVAAVVLNQAAPAAADDLSTGSNRDLLAERLRCPVLVFPAAPGPHAGRLAVVASGLDRALFPDLVTS